LIAEDKTTGRGEEGTERRREEIGFFLHYLSAQKKKGNSDAPRGLRKGKKKERKVGESDVLLLFIVLVRVRAERWGEHQRNGEQEKGGKKKERGGGVIEKG